MTSPVLALRAAIVSRCAADPALVAILGGVAAIHDEPPAGAEPVYLHFGDAELADWSTGSDLGYEQRLGIVAWGRPGSAASAIAAAERVAVLLDEASLALVGHRLVQIRFESTALERDDETNLCRVTVRLRAVTEVTG